MISIYSGGNHVENSANISNKEQYTQINKTKSNMIKKWETDCLAILWKDFEVLSVAKNENSCSRYFTE